VAALIDDDDDGKLAADLEFKMMAMNLAAKEQQEYCQRLVSVILRHNIMYSIIINVYIYYYYY
jgi:hypothetical protein